MATSDYFNTSKVGNFYFTFSWRRTGYSSTANEHYIYYELIAHNTAGNYRTVYLKDLYVDGKQVFYHAGTSGNGKKYYDGDTVTSGNITVKSSNSSGDGTLSASFQAGVGSYPGSNCSGSDSWSLDRIPRYATSNQSLNSRTINTIKMNWSSDSTIDYIWYSINNGSSWTGVDVSDGTSGSYTISGLSANTTYQIKTRVRRKDSQLTTDSGSLSVTTYQKGTISSAPNFNDEENPTITYSNPSGNTVTSLQACIASPNGQIIHVGYRDISKTGTSYTFSLTAAERTTLRKASANSAELDIKFYVKTVSGGVTYYSTLDKKMTIKDGKPIFSDFNVEDVDETILALTGNSQKYIRKYSDIKVTISSANKMVAQKEATPKSYNIIVGGQNKLVTYSTSELTTTINNMDNNKIEVYAIDSRNKQTPVSKSLDIIDYKEIVLNNIKFERKNSVEETILVTGSGTWTNVNFGAVVNSIKSFVFRRKNKKETTWSDWYSIKELFNINTNGMFSNKVENEFTAVTFDFGEEYDIEIKIEDELSVVNRSISVNSGKILMSALKEEGVGFGGIYDKTKGGVLQSIGLASLENLHIEDLEVISDCNNTDLKTGFYYCIGSALNAPFSSAWTIQVMRKLAGDGDLVITQIAYRYRDNEIWIRNYNSLSPAGWKDWTPLILENNSNAQNGCIKFANGTMFCYGRKYITVDLSGAWANIYSSGGLNPGITFAEKFKTVISCNAQYIYHSYTAWIGDLAYTESGITNIQFFRATAAPSATYCLAYQAFGTWK